MRSGGAVEMTVAQSSADPVLDGASAVGREEQLPAHGGGHRDAEPSREVSRPPSSIALVRDVAPAEPTREHAPHQAELLQRLMRSELDGLARDVRGLWVAVNGLRESAAHTRSLVQPLSEGAATETLQEVRQEARDAAKSLRQELHSEIGRVYTQLHQEFKRATRCQSSGTPHGGVGADWEADELPPPKRTGAPPIGRSLPAAGAQDVLPGEKMEILQASGGGSPEVQPGHHAALSKEHLEAQVRSLVQRMDGLSLDVKLAKERLTALEGEVRAPPRELTSPAKEMLQRAKDRLAVPGTQPDVSRRPRTRQVPQSEGPAAGAETSPACRYSGSTVDEEPSETSTKLFGDWFSQLIRDTVLLPQRVLETPPLTEVHADTPSAGTEIFLGVEEGDGGAERAACPLSPQQDAAPDVDARPGLSERECACLEKLVPLLMSSQASAEPTAAQWGSLSKRIADVEAMHATLSSELEAARKSFERVAGDQDVRNATVTAQLGLIESRQAATDREVPKIRLSCIPGKEPSALEEAPAALLGEVSRLADPVAEGIDASKKALASGQAESSRSTAEEPEAAHDVLSVLELDIARLRADVEGLQADHTLAAGMAAREQGALHEKVSSLGFCVDTLREELCANTTAAGARISALRDELHGLLPDAPAAPPTKLVAAFQKEILAALPGLHELRVEFLGPLAAPGDKPSLGVTLEELLRHLKSELSSCQSLPASPTKEEPKDASCDAAQACGDSKAARERDGAGAPLSGDLPRSQETEHEILAALPVLRALRTDFLGAPGAEDEVLDFPGLLRELLVHLKREVDARQPLLPPGSVAQLAEQCDELTRSKQAQAQELAQLQEEMRGWSKRQLLKAPPPDTREGVPSLAAEMRPGPKLELPSCQREASEMRAEQVSHQAFRQDRRRTVPSLPESLEVLQLREELVRLRAESAHATDTIAEGLTALKSQCAANSAGQGREIEELRAEVETLCATHALAEKSAAQARKVDALRSTELAAMRAERQLAAHVMSEANELTRLRHEASQRQNVSRSHPRQHVARALDPAVQNDIAALQACLPEQPENREQAAPRSERPEPDASESLASDAAGASGCSAVSQLARGGALSVIELLSQFRDEFRSGLGASLAEARVKSGEAASQLRGEVMAKVDREIRDLRQDNAEAGGRLESEVRRMEASLAALAREAEELKRRCEAMADATSTGEALSPAAEQPWQVGCTEAVDKLRGDLDACRREQKKMRAASALAAEKQASVQATVASLCKRLDCDAAVRERESEEAVRRQVEALRGEVAAQCAAMSRKLEGTGGGSGDLCADPGSLQPCGAASPMAEICAALRDVLSELRGRLDERAMKDLQLAFGDSLAECGTKLYAEVHSQLWRDLEGGVTALRASLAEQRMRDVNDAIAERLAEIRLSLGSQVKLDAQQALDEGLTYMRSTAEELASHSVEQSVRAAFADLRLSVDQYARDEIRKAADEGLEELRHIVCCKLRSDLQRVTGDAVAELRGRSLEQIKQNAVAAMSQRVAESREAIDDQMHRELRSFIGEGMIAIRTSVDEVCEARLQEAVAEAQELKHEIPRVVAQSTAHLHAAIDEQMSGLAARVKEDVRADMQASMSEAVLDFRRNMVVKDLHTSVSEGLSELRAHLGQQEAQLRSQHSALADEIKRSVRKVKDEADTASRRTALELQQIRDEVDAVRFRAEGCEHEVQRQEAQGKCLVLALREELGVDSLLRAPDFCDETPDGAPGLRPNFSDATAATGVLPKLRRGLGFAMQRQCEAAASTQASSVAAVAAEVDRLRSSQGRVESSLAEQQSCIERLRSSLGAYYDREASGSARGPPMDACRAATASPRSDVAGVRAAAEEAVASARGPCSPLQPGASGLARDEARPPDATQAAEPSQPAPVRQARGAREEQREDVGASAGAPAPEACHQADPLCAAAIAACPGQDELPEELHKLRDRLGLVQAEQAAAAARAEQHRSTFEEGLQGVRQLAAEFGAGAARRLDALEAFAERGRERERERERRADTAAAAAACSASLPSEALGDVRRQLSELQVSQLSVARAVDEIRDTCDRHARRSISAEALREPLAAERAEADRRTQQAERRWQRALRDFQEPLEEALAQLVAGVLRLAQLIGVAADDAYEKFGWREACADLPRMLDHAWLRSRLPKRSTVLKMLRQKADADHVRELSLRMDAMASGVAIAALEQAAPIAAGPGSAAARRADGSQPPVLAAWGSPPSRLGGRGLCAGSLAPKAAGCRAAGAEGPVEAGRSSRSPSPEAGRARGTLAWAAPPPQDPLAGSSGGRCSGEGRSLTDNSARSPPVDDGDPGGARWAERAPFTPHVRRPFPSSARAHAESPRTRHFRTASTASSGGR